MEVESKEVQSIYVDVLILDEVHYIGSIGLCEVVHDDAPCLGEVEQGIAPYLSWVVYGGALWLCLVMHGFAPYHDAVVLGTAPCLVKGVPWVVGDCVQEEVNLVDDDPTVEVDGLEQVVVVLVGEAALLGVKRG